MKAQYIVAWLRHHDLAFVTGVNKLGSSIFPSLHHRKETSEVLSQHQLFGCQSNSQARAAELKAFAVKSFIVQRSIFPATKDNADPFERQGAYGGMMGFSALPLVVVVSPSPNRSEDGL